MYFFKHHKIVTILLLAFSLFVYINFTRIVDYDRNKNTKDEHYVNELYKSDGRIYKKHLGTDEQRMYMHLLKSAQKYSLWSNIDMEKFGCYDYEDCADIIDYANQALYVDHPELMNYSGYRWKYDNGKFTLYLQYAFLFPPKEAIGILRTEKVISDIKEKTKNMSDKEKIIYVYDWMGKNNDYDHLFTYSAKNQSVYNVFVKRNAVCAGFAKASQMIFSNIGIKSYIVQGSTSAEHMWNIVEYNGKYYYFDSTVSVGTIQNHKVHYNGLRQYQFSDYSVNHPDWYPEVETENMFEI
ncbi:MAG: hypothetical protein IJ193_04935 [Bacilli bacterium]|nr:hypothetical protein [Bacilli bacterium]